MQKDHKFTYQLLVYLLLINVLLSSCKGPDSDKLTSSLEKESRQIEEPSINQIGIIPIDNQECVLGRAHLISLREQNAESISTQIEELSNKPQENDMQVSIASNHHLEHLYLSKGVKRKHKEEKEQVKTQRVSKRRHLLLEKDYRESTIIWEFENLPAELLAEIFSYLNLKELLAFRQTNHYFYQSITGYEQTSLVGVANKPSDAKLPIPTLSINRIIKFSELPYTPETIPSFFFYCLVRKAKKLPLSFWSYLKWSRIHTLSLNFNEIGSSGVGELATVLLDSHQIHTLKLERNEVDPEGAEEVAKVLRGTHIHMLCSKSNKTNFSGIHELIEVLPRTCICKLKLDGNKIDDEQVEELAKVLPNTQIHTLNLRNNNICDNGVRALAKILPATQINTLNLSSNKINSGVQELFRVLPDTHIHTLDLENNDISDKKVKKLAKILPRTHIRVLFLDFNKIGNKGARKLAKVLPNTQLHTLNLEGNEIKEDIICLLQQKKQNITFYF